MQGRWQAIARSNLREEFYRIRRRSRGTSCSKRGSKKDVAVLVDDWLGARPTMWSASSNMIDRNETTRRR